MKDLPTEILIDLLELHCYSASPFTLHLVTHRLYSTYLAYQARLLRILLIAHRVKPFCGYALSLSALPQGFWHPWQRPVGQAHLVRTLQDALRDFEDPTEKPEDKCIEKLSVNQLQAAFRTHKIVRYIALSHMYETFQHWPQNPMTPVVNWRFHVHILELYKFFVYFHQLTRPIYEDGPETDAEEAIFKLLAPGESGRLRNGSGAVGILHIERFVTRMFASFEDGTTHGDIAVSREEEKPAALRKRMFNKKKVIFTTLWDVVSPGRSNRRPLEKYEITSGKSAAWAFARDASLELVYRFVKEKTVDGRWEVFEYYMAEVEKTYSTGKKGFFY